MLILRRRPGEKIVISHEALPGDILLEHSGGVIHQRITAHPSVRICRAELVEDEPKPPRAA